MDSRKDELLDRPALGKVYRCIMYCLFAEHADGIAWAWIAQNRVLKGENSAAARVHVVREKL